MKVRIQNYREIKDASLDFPLIAIVEGPNKSGKSSIIGAIRAALLRDAKPDFGYHSFKMTKEDLKSLVHNDGEMASVAFGTGKDCKTVVVWPAGTVDTIGEPATASPVACGSFSESIATQDQKARAEALGQMMARELTKDDFQLGLEGLKQEMIDAVWGKYVKLQSIAIMHDDATEKMKARKQKWEAITGVKFGAKKMKEWTPIGWHKGLNDMTLEEAQAALETAATAEAELRAEAGQVNAQADREMVARAGATQEALTKAKATLQEWQGKRGSAIKARDSLPPPEEGQLAKCPHCEEDVRINAIGGFKFELNKADTELTDEEIAKRRADYADANKAVFAADDRIRATEASITLLERDLKLASEAQERLDNIPKGIDHEALEAAAKATAQARLNFTLVQTVDNANKQMAVIEIGLMILHALSPQGIRKTVMQRNLGEFNADLGMLSELLGVPDVQIDLDNFDVTIGGRSYRDESGSERLRARIALQLATARMEKAGMVLIDDDVDQDEAYIKRLLKCLLTIKMPAVISYHVDNVKRAIDVSKAPDAVREAVRCYWVGNHTVVDVAKAKEVANGAA